MNFIVMSPVYEILRYGHDQIKKQTIDAHTLGKLSKLIIGKPDLINQNLPPLPDNFRFEKQQFYDADIVIFVHNKINITLKTPHTNFIHAL